MLSFHSADFQDNNGINIGKLKCHSHYTEPTVYLITMSRVGEFLLYTPDAFKVNLEAIESEGVSINFSYTSAFWYNVIVYCVMFALLSTSYSVQLFQSIIPALKVIREQELANFMCQVASTVNSLYISSTSIYAISKLSFYGDSVEGVTCFLKLWLAISLVENQIVN